MILFTSSCKKAGTAAQETPAATEGELKDLVLEPIPGSSVQYARQKSATGAVQIEGFVENGKKTGMWIQYGPEGDIQLINHYVDGLLEGTAMRMTFRNQVDLRMNYKLGKLDGPWTSYKFGKILEERFYKNDKLHGIAKTYDSRNWRLKQEAEYKDGVQDGIFRYYDEEGNLTLEYEYKNGEKVSGGIVSKPKK